MSSDSIPQTPKPLQVIKHRIVSFVACDKRRAIMYGSDYSSSESDSETDFSLHTAKPVIMFKPEGKSTLRVSLPYNESNVIIPKLFVTPPTPGLDEPEEDVKLWTPFGDEGMLVQGGVTHIDIPDSDLPLSLKDGVSECFVGFFEADMPQRAVRRPLLVRREETEDANLLLVPKNSGRVLLKRSPAMRVAKSARPALQRAVVSQQAVFAEATAITTDADMTGEAETDAEEGGIIVGIMAAGIEATETETSAELDVTDGEFDEEMERLTEVAYLA